VEHVEHAIRPDHGALARALRFAPGDKSVPASSAFAGACPLPSSAGAGTNASSTTLAQDVADRDVALLDPRGHCSTARRRPHRSARPARLPRAPVRPTTLMRGRGPPRRRRARSSTYRLVVDRDQDVPWSTECIDLPREDVLVPVIVRDRGERRGIPWSTRIRRERAAIGDEAPDELGRDVLRIGLRYRHCRTRGSCGPRGSRRARARRPCRSPRDRARP